MQKLVKIRVHILSALSVFSLATVFADKLKLADASAAAPARSTIFPITADDLGYSDVAAFGGDRLYGWGRGIVARFVYRPRGLRMA